MRPDQSAGVYFSSEYVILLELYNLKHCLSVYLSFRQRNKLGHIAVLLKVCLITSQFSSQKETICWRPTFNVSDDN